MVTKLVINPVGGGDLGGAATTNDAIVSVGGVNGTGGNHPLTIGGTGTDANVDYTSPTYTTSVRYWSSVPY